MKKSFVLWFITAGVWALILCLQLIYKPDLKSIVLYSIACAASLIAAFINLKKYRDNENKE